mmetsp:Transcript_19024/g.24964  ORF Transcript_19024/g.24964 Transcript_19024/m.24964 type:complete len:83 (+) Transcript_19024:600-848(+)
MCTGKKLKRDFCNSAKMKRLSNTGTVCAVDSQGVPFFYLAPSIYAIEEDYVSLMTENDQLDNFTNDYSSAQNLNTNSSILSF